MSDETYYTVLNVKETATPSEIKTAYRDLIKQVHPDTITNLAPYLRRIAEEKTKEITEAYTVLSSSSKRREYDSQLAGYRRQTVPQTPPPATPSPRRQAPSQTSSGPYCNRCGTSLYASGICPKCNKFTAPTATPPQPKAVRWLGYNWAPSMRWSSEHPVIVVFAVLFSVVFIASFFQDANTSQSPESKPPSTNAAAASTGPYSKYPCDFRDKISPIDGKPCSERQGEPIPAPPPGFTVGEKATGTQSPTPTVSVSGAYVGTVHNQTANLSSRFAVVIHQTKDGVLDGCMKVQPPLYGSGVLRGSVRRSRANFVVADITFQGDASKSGIAGSYVVTRKEGNQLGEFNLMKQAGAEPSYHCEDGVLTAASQAFSDVPPGYKVLPPATNLTVGTPNAPATGSKPPAEARAGPKQPDLSSLTYSGTAVHRIGVLLRQSHGRTGGV
jgi:DnaJ domain